MSSSSSQHPQRSLTEGLRPNIYYFISLMVQGIHRVLLQCLSSFFTVYVLHPCILIENTRVLMFLALVSNDTYLLLVILIIPSLPSLIFLPAASIQTDYQIKTSKIFNNFNVFVVYVKAVYFFDSHICLLDIQMHFLLSLSSEILSDYCYFFSSGMVSSEYLKWVIFLSPISTPFSLSLAQFFIWCFLNGERKCTFVCHISL